MRGPNRGGRQSWRMLSLIALLSASVLLPSVQANPGPKRGFHTKHVLLISVDGLHGIDLKKWVDAHPGSALAELAEHGYQYNNASCSKPSDSFPGLMSLITGGSPNATGIWYDASYDRTYLPPGGGAPGTAMTYDESIDLLKNVPNTDNPTIDTTNLPLHPATLKPVMPWELLRVNTIFEVAKSHGLRTAWSDKHTGAYQIVRGPSGAGIDDYYSPEVTNSVLTGGGFDFTTSHVLIKTNDDLKVDAIENEAMGLDHTGKKHVGAPNLFGMNFQSVSVGQKLKVDPVDATLTGGYLNGDADPGPALEAALKYVDGAIGDIVGALKKGGIYDDTTLIITAKHGQSPIDVKKRIAAKDSFYADALNAAVPTLGDNATVTTDTIALIWLAPSQQGFTQQAVDAIRAKPELNTSASGLPLIDEILWGESLKRLYNDPTKDSRTPDIIVIPTPGVIYTGGSKLAEHGGFSREDTSVALLVSNPALGHKTFKNPVQTFQVAPTIMKILGLDPDELQAVQKEHTDELPGFDGKE
jgi:predicted AlkP superfamily pyrophosphatase or phosphodiesterase